MRPCLLPLAELRKSTEFRKVSCGGVHGMAYCSRCAWVPPNPLVALLQAKSSGRLTSHL